VFGLDRFHSIRHAFVITLLNRRLFEVFVFRADYIDI